MAPVCVNKDTLVWIVAYLTAHAPMALYQYLVDAFASRDISELIVMSNSVSMAFLIRTVFANVSLVTVETPAKLVILTATKAHRTRAVRHALTVISTALAHASVLAILSERIAHHTVFMAMLLMARACVTMDIVEWRATIMTTMMHFPMAISGDGTSGYCLQHL